MDHKLYVWTYIKFLDEDTFPRLRNTINSIKYFYPNANIHISTACKNTKIKDILKDYPNVTMYYQLIELCAWFHFRHIHSCFLGHDYDYILFLNEFDLVIRQIDYKNRLVNDGIQLYNKLNLNQNDEDKKKDMKHIVKIQDYDHYTLLHLLAKNGMFSEFKRNKIWDIKESVSGLIIQYSIVKGYFIHNSNILFLYLPKEHEIFLQYIKSFKDKGSKKLYTVISKNIKYIKKPNKVLEFVSNYHITELAILAGLGCIYTYWQS